MKSLISPWNPIKLAIKFRMFPLNSQAQDFCWWVFQTLFTWAIGIMGSFHHHFFWVARRRPSSTRSSGSSRAWTPTPGWRRTVADHGRPWQTMADHGRWKPNRGGWMEHPKHETVMVIKNRGTWKIWPSEDGYAVKWWLRNGDWVATKRGTTNQQRWGRNCFLEPQGLKSHHDHGNLVSRGQTSSPYKNLGWFQIQNMSSLWTQWFPNHFYPLGHGLYPNLLNYWWLIPQSIELLNIADSYCSLILCLQNEDRPMVIWLNWLPWLGWPEVISRSQKHIPLHHHSWCLNHQKLDGFLSAKYYQRILHDFSSSIPIILPISVKNYHDEPPVFAAGHLGEDGLPEAGAARGWTSGRDGWSDDQAADAARCGLGFEPKGFGGAFFLETILLRGAKHLDMFLFGGIE